MRDIGIGLIGAGVVGGGVVKILRDRIPSFRDSLGLPLRLVRVVDKDASRLSELPVGEALCSGEAEDILADSAVDVVVELVGGTGFAHRLVCDALRRGKHVVTANKALLAERGPDIFESAGAGSASVHFEAAVGGGMPVIKTIRETLVGNRISSVRTIINGTCNYILSEMTSRGLPFDKALEAAQRKGYAEADPSLDVGGGDTGHKIAIMASLLYGGYVPFESISIEGITGIEPEDIACAAELGYCVKLLGIINSDDDGGTVDVRVHPAMLRTNHILASVSGVFNAVQMRGDRVGEMLVYGKGAGEMPTASAVVGDIVDVARDIKAGSPQRFSTDFYRADNILRPRSSERLRSRYYLRLNVVDRPGVLAAIAAGFGAHEISVASVMQREGASPESVPVVFLTHAAEERSLRAALVEIEKLDCVKGTAKVLRIEE